jgi:hypothetical protein
MAALAADKDPPIKRKRLSNRLNGLVGVPLTLENKKRT